MLTLFTMCVDVFYMKDVNELVENISVTLIIPEHSKLPPPTLNATVQELNLHQDMTCNGIALLVVGKFSCL